MRMPCKAVRGALVVAVLVGAGSLILGLLPGTGGALFAAEGTNHPEIDDDEALMPCQVCHIDVSEDVVNEWWTGPHGKFNVKCFVCHGALQDNFNAKPGTDFCISCHQDQVEAMTNDFMKDKDCFSCHPQHLLIPHLKVQQYQGERP